MTTRRAHPQKELLLRFLRGEATLAESREVVRHLLSGCPECVALTKPVWERADGFALRTARRRKERARAQEGGDVIEEARAELLAVVTDLREIRQRLKRVHASLPLSTQENSQEDLDAEPDVTTEMRAVIGNGLNDSLRPLISDLLGAASYGQSLTAKSGPTNLDITSNTEMTRRTLYELVVSDNFAIGPWPESEEEDTRHPYTPEEAGLELVHLWGRWFASWWRLEASPDLPDSERREVLVLSENPARPGTLHYREVED